MCRRDRWCCCRKRWMPACMLACRTQMMSVSWVWRERSLTVHTQFSLSHHSAHTRPHASACIKEHHTRAHLVPLLAASGETRGCIRYLIYMVRVCGRGVHGAFINLRMATPHTHSVHVHTEGASCVHVHSLPCACV